MQSAIVLDGNLKHALCVVRSLGKEGVRVFCGAERSTAMSRYSRYCVKGFTYTSPKVDQAAFIQEVIAEAKELGDKPVLYAMSDATWLSLWQHKTEIDAVATVLWPSDHAIEIGFDKGATYSEARLLGIPIIDSWLRERKEEVVQVAEVLEYPAVVKTRRSVTWHDGKGVSGTARFVHDKEELLQVFQEIVETTGEAPLIQRFIKGEEYGVEMLVTDGRVIAETIHHRIRSLSPTGGASVVKETIGDSELTESMCAHAYTLAKELFWNGPMMVEFKLDSDSKEVLLMEINGRWWGSLPLAAAAGVDFPYLYYELATGARKAEGMIKAEEDVTTRHFLGDVVHLLRVFFARDKMRPVLYPGRRKAWRDFLKSPQGTKSDVWSWSDTRPGIMEYIDAVAKKFS